MMTTPDLFTEQSQIEAICKISLRGGTDLLLDPALLSFRTAKHLSHSACSSDRSLMTDLANYDWDIDSIAGLQHLVDPVWPGGLLL